MAEHKNGRAGDSEGAARLGDKRPGVHGPACPWHAGGSPRQWARRLGAGCAVVASESAAKRGQINEVRESGASARDSET